jgi:hypothetical protein
MLPTTIRTLRPLAWAAVALVCLSAPLAAQTSAVASRITQPIDENVRVTLHGYVPPQANAANDRGAAPDSMPLERMHLVLKRSASQEAALEQLLAAQNTPGSASYHKWLTPAQFGQQFGPSDQDIATVESWLSSHGFDVAGVKPGKQVIEFSGNVAELRDAFHTQIHQYKVNGNLHYSAASEPQIPAALAPVVAGFVSLNDFHVKNDVHVLGEASYDPKTGTARPQWTLPGGGGAPTLGGVAFAVSPADFYTQYDLSPLYNAGINGTGESIAIINDSNINLDLVKQFRSLFGLPTANLPTVIIDGNDPGIDGINNPDGPNYDSVEAYLDVELSGAVAPDANIDLVIGGDTALESGLILAAEHAVYSDIAPVMSISFGECEYDLESDNEFFEELWEQAAAQGITVMVSAGDSGSAGCDDGGQDYAVDGLGINGFASTPYNVAVGGTDFYYPDYQNLTLTDLAADWSTAGTNTPPAGGSLLQSLPEQPWNDSQFGLNAVNYYSYYGATSIAGGSGGASSDALCVSGTNTEDWNSEGECAGTLKGYAKPAWQSGTGVPSDGVRDIPDVSLFAANDANYSFYAFCYADGDCQPASGGSPVQISAAGGTSFASPGFAGIMALVNQKYGPQGQADAVLYPLKAQDPAAFHDILQGTNSVACEMGSPDCIAVTNPIVLDGITEGQIGAGSTPDYNAAAGYTLATGLGSVDAYQLVEHWNSIAFAQSGTTLTSPTAGATYTHGEAIAFSGSVTGSPTPTGDVAIMTSSAEPVNQGQTTLALNSSGAFSGSYSYLPGGTYNVWANYGGDAKNGESASTPVQITVKPEASELVYAAVTPSDESYASISGQSVPYGSQLYFSVIPVPSADYSVLQTCTTNCPSFTSATGTVAFSDSGTVLNTAPLDAEGEAEFDTGALPVGSYSMTASYSGDSSYNASTASAVAFTIVKAAPYVYLTAPTNTVVTGQPLTLTVLVESYGLGAAPTGTVTFTGLPSGVAATATLSSSADYEYGVTTGVATVTLPTTTPAGSYKIGASYGGDTNYAAAASTATAVTVTGSASKANCAPDEAGATSACMASSIAASANSTTTSATAAVTISATVTGESGTAAPTGDVYLFIGLLNPETDGNSAMEGAIDGAALKPSGTGDTSTATFLENSETLGQGANLLTVYYAGDSNYAASSYVLDLSNPLSDFSLTSASSIVSVPASGTGTTSLYVTPVNGFNGTVNLTCAAPTGVTCSLASSSVTLSSSSTTTGPISQNRRLDLFATGGGALFACVLLLAIPAKRRAWRNMLCLVLLVCVAGFGMIGCGGGSGTTITTTGSGGSGGGGGSTAPANPTQSVQLTITTSGAAAGNDSVAVTGTSGSQIHTLGITAAVQ